MNLDHKKKVKMHWLQHPDQSNLDNLNNIRREGSRHFRNKKKQCLKSKLTDLKVKKKIRDWCRGNSDLKKGYHPRNNIVQDEKGDLVAVSHSVLVGWRKRFSQLFVVYLLSDFRQQKFIQQSY
jgi:hypothetical protein